jgi:GAF domain-containing protein
LPPGSPEEFSTNLPDFEAALDNYDKAKPFFVAELKVNDNTLEQGAIVTMKAQNWYVVYAQGQDTFLAAINAQARNNILLALAIGVVVALFGLLMAQTLAGPIVRLTQTAEAIAGGDINIQAKVETGDEIGTLAGTFNRMTQQLRDFIATLESRVAERTQNLELAAEVGRTVSQVRALDVMLTEAAELIRTQFDLYYVQVYLVNPSQTYLDLQAGTGHVGEELLKRKHRLPFNTGSINGRAAVGKKSVVIKDTTLSTTFRPNPLLPDTRSEIAVPLIIGDKVVGVLDIQSEHAGSLDDVLPAFEALAGQLAIAIQNANFLAETQQARADVEAQAQRQTRTNWMEYLDAIHKPEETGFVFEQNRISALTQEVEIKDNALVTPITVTGEALGNLVVELEGQSPIARTDELLNTVARQVSQHIEALRLLDSADRFRYEAEQASRRLTHEGWQEYKDANVAKGTGYIYDQKEVRPYEQDEIEQAEKTGMSVPLKIRDEAIGKLVLQGIDTNDSEAVGIANAVAERLGAHIEGLRLAMQTEKALSTTKKQAQREQALRQITSAVRGSTDPATILRTAARELGSLLGRQTIVQLTTENRAETTHPNEDEVDSRTATTPVQEA